MKVLMILMVFLCNTVNGVALFCRELPKCNFHEQTASQAIDTNHLDNLRIRSYHLEIIPPSSGVQFYRDGIIFLSHSSVEEKVPERHQAFGSIRTCISIIGDTIPISLSPFDLSMSAPFPSEATTFSSDYNTMYLSLIPEKANSEKIFKAEYISSRWEIEDKPLEICNENYIYSHPCLSEDGSFMIFSSDVAGSAGGLDLWITRKVADGWSSPRNLGRHINSPGNELFASLDSWNNLYFSSDGLPGKGGYDIFVARYNGTGWDKPINLPEEINTKNDELAYTINNKDNRTAFYTTRTRSGKYKTQLYIIDLNKGDSPGDVPSLSENFLASEYGKPATDSSNNISTTTITAQLNTETKPSSPASTQFKESAETKEVSTSSSPGQRISDPDLEKEKETPATNAATTVPTKTVKESESFNQSDLARSTQEIIKDEVVYRVQILANTRPVGSQKITVDGKTYESFEYLYKGGYRTTIGAFSTFNEAIRLQTVCRRSGYDQAFVVAFKNNIRSTDPGLFK